MIQTNVILVIGYNNTRINDVKKIQKRALESLNAQTVLCKKSPTEEDRNAVDHVIDVDLSATAENVRHVIEECTRLDFKIIAILPFSDPGTQLGAALADALRLPGHDKNKILAAFDKSHFRKQESETQNAPENYLKVGSQRIHSYDELAALFHKNKKVFLKPACEGNSRGCIAIHNENDLKTAWPQLEKYLSAGVVAEQLITNAEEYSWDHINGHSWITEKETTQNSYRAEIQQIVPAFLTEEKAKMLNEAGHFMAELCGHHNAACHNEIFFLKESNQVAAVEPNLRPAGMRIWDLAALAFQNFNPWEEWLKWATHQKSEITQLTREYYSGIRMIGAKQDGVLKHLPEPQAYPPLSSETSIIEIVWTKKVNDRVSATQKDNADFIGYVIARSKDYAALKRDLKELTVQLADQVEIIKA